MLNAPRKVTWWIAVAITLLSAILLAVGQARAAALGALSGLLLMIIATKLGRR